MNCPVCGERLREINRHGVDIDICPSCKGVWLDRGELEKIIDMTSNGSDMSSQSREPLSQSDRAHDDDRRYERDERHHDHDYDERDGHGPVHGKRRKREGLLGEIFDIFG